MDTAENRDVKLNHTRMKEAQYLRNLWVVTVECGVTKEDLMTPSFWSHVSFQFKPYDRLEVRTDDGAFFAEYLVLLCDRTFAKLHELSWHTLHKIEVTDKEDPYEVKWRGPHVKFSVIRKSDGAVMVENLEVKQQAIDWIINHKKLVEI